jgi:hypothetical protein
MNLRTICTVAALTVAISGSVVARQSGLKSGIDAAQFDKAVRPQDDFFRYVNGTWLTKTEIPADRPVYATFIQVDEKTEARIRPRLRSQEALHYGQSRRGLRDPAGRDGGPSSLADRPAGAELGDSVGGDACFAQDGVGVLALHGRRRVVSVGR